MERPSGVRVGTRLFALTGWTPRPIIDLHLKWPVAATTAGGFKDGVR